MGVYAGVAAGCSILLAGAVALIYIAYVHHKINTAVACIPTLLLPIQQPLPEALTQHLEQALRANESNDAQTSYTHLQRAIELAQQWGYL